MKEYSNEAVGSLVSLSEEISKAVEGAGSSVVAINAHHRIPSSGVYWREGVVVTVAHSIRRDEDILVTLPSGAAFSATLAGKDSGTDLAVLKLAGGECSIAPRSGASELRAGNLAIAVGRSAGRGVTSALGIVNSAGEAWRTWRGGVIDKFIGLDIALYPGLQGGALVDATGAIAGTVTSGLSRHLPLAIPNSTIDRVVDQILEKGHLERGFVGVGLYPVQLPSALVRSLGLTRETGLMVVSLEPAGPAESAGLMLGDVLIELGGTPVLDTNDVQAKLEPEQVGKVLVATVIRSGARLDQPITVGGRPARRERHGHCR